MIFSTEHKWVFIHIPRTGGISITTSLKAAVPTATATLVEGRHVTAWKLKQRDPVAWDKLYRFSTMRSPWDIIASDYRLTLKDVPNQPDDGWTPGWIARVERIRQHMSFDRFVEEEYLGKFSCVHRGGFWKTWCCDLDGSDLGVTMYRFDQLPEVWPEIAARCGVPDAQLPHVNAGVVLDVVWRPDLRAAVGQLCRDDIQRFGYV